MDDTVRSVTYGYDDLGRTNLITSWSNADGTGDIRNQIKYWFDAWGNVVRQYQSHSGAVDDDGQNNDDTPYVGYTYSDGAVDGVAKYNRLASVTDPDGIMSKTYFDAMGRTIESIAAYTDGTPTNSTNQITTYTYNSLGQMVSVTADMPTGTPDQVTQYVYGVSTANGSYINSNSLLRMVQYPDKTTGQPSTSASSQVRYTYDAMGRVLTKTDQNGSVHAYTYDSAGRLAADEVTALGSGVDGAVRKIGYSYDDAGRLHLLTSYDASSAVLSQIRYDYNGLGQLVAEWQSVSGAVTASTPKVQYGYDALAHGSRLVSMTYPDGRQIDYNYDMGLDSTISRLSSISDTTGTLESYSYLGDGTVVVRNHPQAGVELTYVKLTGESDGDAGDQYTGLDRFGRVADQRWIETSSGDALDRFGYTYDRAGSRLTKSNLVNGDFSEDYTYDSLNRLAASDRGEGDYTQSWELDSVGNMTTITTDGADEDRTYNSQNQIVGLTYDNNGNTLTDGTGNQFVYDAWNRMVVVKDSEGNVLETFVYDAAGRKITISPMGETTQVLYYSAQWQVLEERQGSSVTTQYTWSPVYVDAMICRDRDADSNSENGLEERMYVEQDANFNVTAILDTTGAVVERYVEDAYGKFTVLNADWSPRANNASTKGWLYIHHGGRYDHVANTFDFERRVYSVVLSRWMQQDPVYSVPNLYCYCGDSPLIYVDPSGLTKVVSDKPFPGAEGGNGRYCRHIDDGQTGTVELKRITWEDVHAEEKNLVNTLHNLEKIDGERRRRYEGGFDSTYFVEGEQRQYYLVDHQNEIYADNEINYIAIGLYEAWIGDSLSLAKVIVWGWKVVQYRTVPTEGTMYWLEEGYNNYPRLPNAPTQPPRPEPPPRPKARELTPVYPHYPLPFLNILLDNNTMA